MGDWVAVVAALVFAVWITVRAGWVYSLPAWMLVVAAVAVPAMRRARRSSPEAHIDPAAQAADQPRPVDQTAASWQVATDIGFVRVERESWPWPARYRKFHVVLDGESVAKLRRGADARFQVKPGPHSLVIRIDWAESDITFFNVLPNQTVHFRCAATPTTSLRSMFRKRCWVTLSRVES